MYIFQNSYNRAEMGSQFNFDQLNIEDLQKITQDAVNQQNRTNDYRLMIKKQIDESQGQIHEPELKSLLNLMYTYQQNHNKFGFINLSKKVLKFFTPVFDDRPLVQKRALKIYACKPFCETQIVSEEQIKSILRMNIMHKNQDAIVLFVEIVQKLMKNNIKFTVIDLIEKFDSLIVLKEIINYHTDDLTFQAYCTGLVQDHLQNFILLIKKLQTNKETMCKNLFDKINRQFIDLLQNIMFRYQTISEHRLIHNNLLCIVLIFVKLPVFQFSLQNFYKRQKLLHQQYSQLKYKLAQNLYKKKIIQRLKASLYDQVFLERFLQQIFQASVIVLKYLKPEYFFDELVPLMIKYFRKMPCNQTEYISSLLVQFIYRLFKISIQLKFCLSFFQIILQFPYQFLLYQNYQIFIFVFSHIQNQFILIIEQNIFSLFQIQIKFQIQSSFLSLKNNKFKTVYMNQNQQNSHEFFIKIFCDSGLFNLIVRAMECKFEKLCSILHFSTEQDRQKIGENLNLFYLTIIVFEIIDHCEILDQIFMETRQLLQRSVHVIKQAVKKQWVWSLLNNFMSSLIEKQRQLGIIRYPKYRFQQWYEI